MSIVGTLDDALSLIGSGSLLAIPPDYAGVAMAATRALIRRGVHGLRIVTLPTSGMQADLLIGASAVAEIETSAVSLGEAGAAPRFTASMKAGRLAMRDATCPALHAAFQAAEKGVPFLPLRGILGSDLLSVRKDWKVVQNPFAAGGVDDPIVLLPAIRPDVALFHAPKADRNGNVWIGRRRELITMAHASATSVVTVERVVEGDLLADEETAAGTLPALYVGRVAIAERGAWPLQLPGVYGRDDAHVALYAAMAATAEGFSAYLDRYVRGQRAA